MAEKEGRKRKREQQNGHIPNKKAAVESATEEHVKVSWTDNNGLHPAIASCPGLMAPDLPFEAYARSRSTKSQDRPTPPSHDLLLHTSQHPRLDYTASEHPSEELSHYIAIFDPDTKDLTVTPAHHVSLKRTVRSEVEEVERDSLVRTLMQQREELGKEFGTKKAKKVIADRTVNAIARDVKGKGKVDGVQDAILGDMDDITAKDLSKAQLEQALLDAKPIPKPNLGAGSVEEVYPFNVLLPPADARLILVKDWQDTVRTEGESIDFNHRYPATRVDTVGRDDNLTNRLKALKYLTLLLEFHDALTRVGRDGKKVPKKDILAKKLSAWPSALVDSVRKRFSDRNNELSKWYQDNLCTHMCALTLYIDGYTTNTTELKNDLKLDNKQITQYFNELGCKIGTPTEKERETMKLNKAVAAVTRIAKLKLPLEFPKARIARRAR